MATFFHWIHGGKPTGIYITDLFTCQVLDTRAIFTGGTFVFIDSAALGLREPIAPWSPNPVSVAHYRSMSDLKTVMHGKI